MATEDTRAVVEHHEAALDAADVDEIMEDYTEDSVFISNLGGVMKGLDAIRVAFSAAAGPIPGFEKLAEHIDGEVANVTWKADGIAMGTDTFIVRDGKVAIQTVALHFA